MMDGLILFIWDFNYIFTDDRELGRYLRFVDHRSAGKESCHGGPLEALAKSPLENLVIFCLFLLFWHIFCLIRTALLLHVTFKPLFRYL